MGARMYVTFLVRDSNAGTIGAIKEGWRAGIVES